MGIVTPSEDQNAVDMGGLASLSGRDYDSGVAHQPYNGPLNPNPEPGAAPEIDTGYPQGSFAHKLAQSLSATANHPAAPTLLKQPGGFAKMILGASLDALQGNLGDAAAATAPVAPGAGWLSGVLRTEAAGAQRQAAEKQQQFQNNIEQQKAADEHQRNQALIAHENIATRHDQYLVSKLGAEQQEESVKTGKLNMQPFVTGLAPAQIIKEGVTSDDVQALIAQNHLDPTQQHAFPTGLAPVEGKFDESGRQIMRPTYTIIGDVPNVTVDKTNAAFISQFTHHDFKEGQVLPGAQYGYLVQQAASAQTAIASINQARQKNDLEKLSGDLKAQELMMLPDWNEALSKSRNDPFLALRYLQTDSAMAKKYPNAATNVMGLYGGPKEWETMRKDRADEARKLQEDRDKEADKHAAALQDLNVAMTDEMKQRI